MKKLIILVILVSVIFTLLILLKIQPGIRPSVIINNKAFYVDIAKSDNQKSLGLSIYNSMPEDKGMIFPFERAGIYSFWMKGMKFPIDIIYINNNRVVEIFPELPFPKDSTQNPAIVTPKEKANFVLEINAGLSKKYNFKKGDLVKIDI